MHKNTQVVLLIACFMLSANCVSTTYYTTFKLSNVFVYSGNYAHLDLCLMYSMGGLSDNKRMTLTLNHLATTRLSKLLNSLNLSTKTAYLSEPKQWPYNSMWWTTSRNYSAMSTTSLFSWVIKLLLARTWTRSSRLIPEPRNSVVSSTQSSHLSTALLFPTLFKAQQRT
jgi:hypothetical protein